ncbi:hypothetical protein [Paenibacillus solani]|uniref:hypothetical protein n=1 Tax=Paenibacillus solani TaxID=1705565 RepID=UPI003D27BF02
MPQLVIPLLTPYMSDGRMVQQDAVSERVALEILDAHITVSVHSPYDSTEPGEKVSFSLKLENAGSLGAEVTLIDWICEPNIFEEGYVIKGGQILTVHQAYTLGTVAPGEALSFHYSARIRHTVDSLIEEVNGYFLFRSHAKVGDCVHDSKFKSEMITLILESEEDE